MRDRESLNCNVTVAKEASLGCTWSPRAGMVPQRCPNLRQKMGPLYPYMDQLIRCVLTSGNGSILEQGSFLQQLLVEEWGVLTCKPWTASTFGNWENE